MRHHIGQHHPRQVLTRPHRPRQHSQQLSPRTRRRLRIEQLSQPTQQLIATLHRHTPQTKKASPHSRTRREATPLHTLNADAHPDQGPGHHTPGTSSNARPMKRTRATPIHDGTRPQSHPTHRRLRTPQYPLNTNASPSSSTSTFTVSPRSNFPSRILIARGSWMKFKIARASGLAPYSGS